MTGSRPPALPAAMTSTSRDHAHPADGSRDDSSAASAGRANPVLVRLWRGGRVESRHRGAWVLVDPAGSVIDGAGDFDQAIYARSSVKSFQALPLVETGAAERFAYDDADLALALASHNAEAAHTGRVLRVLGRLGLGVGDLQCGPQPPRDPEALRALEASGAAATALHNNCSGKHAGFLALARHLGQPPERYLDPEGEAQRLVRRALAGMSGVPEAELEHATDGCSAPTWRLPLRALATAFARLANPDGLVNGWSGACRWMQRAVARHPDLIAGKHQRICTDIARVSGGRLFPKIGAEGVYGLGVVGGERGLAIKMDDGGARGLHALLVALLERFGFASSAELEALAPWSGDPIRNWAGLEVGRTEVVP